MLMELVSLSKPKSAGDLYSLLGPAHEHAAANSVCPGVRKHLPLDRMLKALNVWLTLGVSALLLSHDYFEETVFCQPMVNDTKEQMAFVDKYCDANLQTLSDDDGYKVYNRIKVFPVLYLSQAVATMLPVLLWEVAAVPHLTTFLITTRTLLRDMVTSFLTWYTLPPEDKMKHQSLELMKRLSEHVTTNIHHCIKYKMKRIHTCYVLKHILHIVVAAIYLLAQHMMWPLDELSVPRFPCTVGSDRVYNCSATDIFALRVVWVMNFFVLGFTCIGSLGCLVHFNFKWQKSYESLYMYQSIPWLTLNQQEVTGANLSRLKLLSSFLQYNEPGVENSAYVKVIKQTLDSVPGEVKDEGNASRKMAEEGNASRKMAEEGNASRKMAEEGNASRKMAEEEQHLIGSLCKTGDEDTSMV